MVAVILAGGKGTRLKPFTMTIPKPLLPLGDMPILEVVIRQLAAAGIGRIVLTLGHMAPLLRATLGDGSKWGVRLEYCIEDEALGTAGALSLVRDLPDHFLVMNGDILTTLDYRKLIAFHCNHGVWGTIALSGRKVQVDYGVVTTTAEGGLRDYTEKPVLRYDVSMGINVLSRRCLRFIRPKRKLNMPELLLAMKRAGKRILCYRRDCYWQDIGRFDDYQKASEDFARDPARFLPDGATR